MMTAGTPAAAALGAQPGGHPLLIFTTDMDGPALLALLDTPGLIAALAAHGCAVAIGLSRYDDETAEAARKLAGGGVQLVAWLLPQDDVEPAFNAQNYPQARTSYQRFHVWAREHDLAFEAVGLDIAPPAEVVRADNLAARYVVQRFWRASDNVLFPAAREAYITLVAAIRHDGYEVHTYQWPVIADDRRAGTTLVQRALEIVDMPSDLDVLICSSAVPEDSLGWNLGGALVAGYGPAADAIGIGAALGGPGQPPPSWPALRRDLLLAARHTDTIYIDSLDGCVEHGLLDSILNLDWSGHARPAPLQRAAVALLRAGFLAVLASARFGPRMFAWAGWGIAVGLWLRGRRRPRP